LLATSLTVLVMPLLALPLADATGAARLALPLVDFAALRVARFVPLAFAVL
jgi:hypothetical protein